MLSNGVRDPEGGTDVISIEDTPDTFRGSLDVGDADGGMGFSLSGRSYWWVHL